MNKTLDSIRQFMDPSTCQPIRDPVWHHIWVPGSFIPLLSAGAFLKLQGIRQLGPTALVYPGATHTRFNHSLGVFQVAKRFLERFLADPGAIGLISEDGAKAFLCAALVHDLGHFPYTHSLKELPLKDHEVLTAELVCAEPLFSHLKNARIDATMVAAIVDTNRPCPSAEAGFYRNVLSGVLDPDKLDYLNRDAYFCGVPYGMQDLDFILSRLYIHEGTRPGIESSGLSSIEHVLFSKYLMYKTVYWHKTVRTATAMIKRSLFCALEEKVIRPEELYNLDDDGFVRLADSRAASFPAFKMVRNVQEKQFHEIAIEFPFDPGNPVHESLTDLEERSRVERKIAYALGRGKTRSLLPWEVVIDIPESISFESGIPVRQQDGTLPYLESGTVFTAAVVRDFTARLRIVRLLLPRGKSELNPDERERISSLLPAAGRPL